LKELTFDGERAGTVSGVDDGEADLVAANAAFYQAFEASSLDAMSDVWMHDDHVACTHPGWATLRGWAAVSASWFALFQNDQNLQVILTRVVPQVRGDVGWVTVDENLIAGSQTATVAALNVFERSDGRWRMAAHHGSTVANS
jgi:ketosteroid isomerase-like protein